MLRKATRGSASPAHLHGTKPPRHFTESTYGTEALLGSYPMRKVEAPLSMTMGVVLGKPAKSVSRSGRYPDGMPAGGDGLAGGGGGGGEGFEGHFGKFCRLVSLRRPRRELAVL
uniref:Uncharacterized protein n=1 Tax=Oryza meridionalis TaxID=40149 RepID=A0A0E0BX11_9ORYZ